MDFKTFYVEDYKSIDVKIRKCSIRTDNSLIKGGTGLAPNPGSDLYAAVSSCMAATAYSYCDRNSLPLSIGVCQCMWKKLKMDPDR